MNSTFCRLQRVIIKTGRWSGLPGAPGRFLGRAVGCPLDCGLRLIINDPMEFIQRSAVARGVYEPEIARLFAAVLRRDDVCYDIGANIGNHTLVAASLGALVRAFEPVPRIADHLARNVQHNRLESRVTIVREAVGDSTGVVTINVSRRTDDGSHSILRGVEANDTQTVDVPITTLDDYHRRSGAHTPALIKIDVEGYEARVLDGAVNILDAAQPPVVVVETGDRLADQIGESARTVLDRLFRRGFKVFAVPESGERIIDVPPPQVTTALRNYVAVRQDSPYFSRLRGCISLS